MRAADVPFTTKFPAGRAGGRRRLRRGGVRGVPGEGARGSRRGEAPGAGWARGSAGRGAQRMLRTAKEKPPAGARRSDSALLLKLRSQKNLTAPRHLLRGSPGATRAPGSSNTPPGARTRLSKPRHGARGPGRLPAAPPCSSRPPRQTSCRQVQPRRALTKGPRRVMHGAAGSCPVIRYRRPPPRVPSVHLPGRGALLRWPW